MQKASSTVTNKSGDTPEVRYVPTSSPATSLIVFIAGVASSTAVEFVLGAVFNKLTNGTSLPTSIELVSSLFGALVVGIFGCMVLLLLHQIKLLQHSHAVSGDVATLRERVSHEVSERGKQLAQEIMQHEAELAERFATLSHSITTQVAELNHRMEGIYERTGIHIRYYGRSEGQSSLQANLYQEASKVVQGAKRSIRVLNSFLKEDESEQDDGRTVQARQAYLDALLKKATDGNIIYRRIIQLGENTRIYDNFPPSYLRHFQDVLDVLAANPNLSSRIGLLKSQARRLSTYVVVDDVHLIWQINEQLENGRTRMSGLFVIEDPLKLITGPFTEYFEELPYSAPKGRVESSDLGPRSRIDGN